MKTSYRSTSEMMFNGLALILLICFLIQVLFAGLALFVHPDHWSQHIMFPRFFIVIPLLMAVLAYFTSWKKQIIWRCIGLSGFMIGLFFTAAVSPSVPFLGAFHPLLAILLFTNILNVLKIKKEMSLQKSNIM